MHSGAINALVETIPDFRVFHTIITSSEPTEWWGWHVEIQKLFHVLQRNTAIPNSQKTFKITRVSSPRLAKTCRFKLLQDMQATRLCGWLLESVRFQYNYDLLLSYCRLWCTCINGEQCPAYRGLSHMLAACGRESLWSASGFSCLGVLTVNEMSPLICRSSGHIYIEWPAANYCIEWDWLKNPNAHQSL